ncbi:uncharacterized protein V1518DRAFT_374873 [Limtongia smithiae]|uniref:uncharacterized protein n=1 Tax=Limtongia smithiae TaxID=1125753 RepID=UPI0034CDA3AB
MDPTAAALSAAKTRLRKVVASRLKNLSYDSIVCQSSNIADIVRSLPEYKTAKNVALYMHMDVSHSVPRKSGMNVEVHTDKIIENAMADGKEVYLPRIVPMTEIRSDLRKMFHMAQHKLHSQKESHFTPKLFLQMLRVPRDEAVGDLEADNEVHGFAIKEPTGGDDVYDQSGLDLIIVPGLVFNSSCKRIGRGKGFYDSYIEQHKVWSESQGRRSPYLVGIGFHEQLISLNDDSAQEDKSFPCEEHDQILDTLVIGDQVFKQPSE